MKWPLSMELLAQYNTGSTHVRTSHSIPSPLLSFCLPLSSLELICFRECRALNSHSKKASPSRKMWIQLVSPLMTACLWIFALPSEATNVQKVSVHWKPQKATYFSFCLSHYFMWWILYLRRQYKQFHQRLHSRAKKTLIGTPHLFYLFFMEIKCNCWLF